MSDVNLLNGIREPLVDERLPTPLYHQVYLVLRDKILSCAYAHGDLLPSEPDTARLFGVARITAKRALNKLAADGLVTRKQGHGTRVIYQPASPVVSGSVEGLLENLLAMGLQTEVQLVAFDYCTPSPEVAEILGVQPPAQVQHAVRVRSLKGEPFSYLTTFVPETIGRSYEKEDLASRPLLSLLERSGVLVGRAEQTVGATLADAGVAALLGCELGSPLLRVSRVVYDQNDSPVEYIVSLYRPDRYQYRMMLSRVGEESARKWSMTG